MANGFPDKYKYFAFISYNHEDIEEAKHLEQFLCDFRLPVRLREKYPDRRVEFIDVFRDNSSMNACHDLSEEIKRHLDDSEYLFVVCSPNSAQSEWVEKEISHFKEKRGENNIYPFVVSGTVNAKDVSQECIPKSLGRPYTGRAANISTVSFEHAVLEIIANIINIDVDEIWQRHVIIEEERKRKLKEQNDKLLIAQSRFVAEKAIEFVENNDSYSARRLLNEVLNDDRPYSLEVEKALRYAELFDTAILRGHGHSIRTYSISQDETKIATVSLDGNVIIWDTATGERLQVFPHEGNVGGLEFSPRGDCLVLATNNKAFICYVHSGDKKELPIECPGVIDTVSFSGDGNYVICAGAFNSPIIWNVKNGGICPLVGHEAFTRNVVFDTDNEHAISASIDKSLKRWNLLTGKCEKTFNAHSQPVTRVTISPDGIHFASISRDASVLIWNKLSGEYETISNNEQEVFQLAYSQDIEGKYLLYISSGKNTIQVWDTASRTMLPPFENPNNNKKGFRYASFSPDCKLVAATSIDNNIYIFDIKTGGCAELKGHTDIPNCVRFIANGTRLVSSSEDHTVRIWDISSKTDNIICEESGFINSLSVNPNNKSINWVSKGIISTWDINTKKLTRGNWRIAGNIISVSRDGKLVATAFSTYALISVWNRQTEGFVRNLEGHTDNITNLCFNTSNNRLVSTSCDNTVRVWDLLSGECRVMNHHTRKVRFATFSPQNDNMVVSVSEDYMGQIWDLSTDQCIPLSKEHTGFVVHAAFSPDGEIVATASYDYTICIWEVKTGKCVNTLVGHSRAVQFVTFSPDGSQVISCSNDKTIKVWDIATGFCIHTFKGHDKGVTKVLVIPCDTDDGYKIVTAGFDYTIRIWHFPQIKKLIEKNITRFGRNPLTSDERRLFYLD